MHVFLLWFLLFWMSNVSHEFNGVDAKWVLHPLSFLTNSFLYFVFERILKWVLHPLSFLANSKIQFHDILKILWLSRKCTSKWMNLACIPSKFFLWILRVFLLNSSSKQASTKLDLPWFSKKIPSKIKLY